MTFSLELNMRNSNGDNSIYTLKNPFFQNFFIGDRRNETNLLMMRKIAEGNIMIKNADYDAVEDYIYSSQDGKFYIDNGTITAHNCKVHFSNPNFTTRRVILSIEFIDQYSLLMEGIDYGDWNDSNIPRKDIEHAVDDFFSSVASCFVDGSQYMYDTQALGSELWGLEYETFTIEYDNVFYKPWILQFNSVKPVNSDNEDLSISDFVPNSYLLDEYYKIKYVKYYHWNPGNSYYESIYIQYVREFRYFEEKEEIPEGWISINTTKEVNGLTYRKYVRPYLGDATYFSGKENYFIHDNTPNYMTLSLQAYDVTIQKTKYFYQLNDLLRKLLTISDLSDFYSEIPDSYYIASLYAYNTFDFFTTQVKFDYFLNFLRTFGIYYENENGITSFRKLSFTEKLLDIDNYLGYNFKQLIDPSQLNVPKIYEFESGTKRPDFGNQKVSFHNNGTSQPVSQGVITDPENTDQSKESFLLIETDIKVHDQIYSKMSLISPTTGIIGIFRTENGKYIGWDTQKMGEYTYIQFNATSNLIHLDIDNYIEISYGVKIYDGKVTVNIGNYTATHTSSAVVNTTTTSTGTEEYFNVTLDSRVGSYSNYKGFLYDIKIRVKTRRPKAAIGKISGLSKLNGNLALSNIIYNNKPLMSYPKGHLENYGSIVCEPQYSESMDVIMPLPDEVFEQDYNKHLVLDGKEYVIFERKQQIIDTNTIVNNSRLNIRTNDIY